QLREGLRVGQREVRQDLAIHLEPRLRESVHESAVGQAVLAGSRIDARDPELAEVALSLLAVPIGVAPAALDGLARALEQAAASAVVALRRVENALAPLLRGDAAFHSCHDWTPRPLVRGRSKPFRDS